MSSAASRYQHCPPPPRRGLSREQAAEYVGVSPNTFDKAVREGILPSAKFIFSRKIWDLRALDSALDMLDSDEVDTNESNPFDNINSL
jgi:hypothetical protein